MIRPVNFSAGPSMIPLEVLENLSGEMVDYNGSGLSLVEVSHRGSVYDEVHNQAIDLLKELLAVPEGYSVLLLAGGATLQFSMMPMNLMESGGSADYVNSGAWAKKAIAEARKIASVNIVWDGSDADYMTLPNPSSIQPRANSAYLHITSNETIGGVQWKSFPNSGSVPLVADMSSDILSRPVDISQFGLIYAGAQKNLGPAGVTVVIIRDDLIGRVSSIPGSYLDYSIHAKNDSMYNTPPVFSIWAMKLVLETVKARGGVEAVTKDNNAQAAELYRTIDESGGFYRCPVEKSVRSNMNIVWRLADTDKERIFIKEAAAAGLSGLKGHRSVGGCRASLYNAMTMDGVTRLTDFMKNFAVK